MAEHQLPKLNTRVRFPSSAPHLAAIADLPFNGCRCNDLSVSWDDPERDVADLERQLAESRAVGDPSSESTRQSALTAEQVAATAFSKPPIGRRGYNENDVDAFLDRVEAALRDPVGHPLTSQQVREVAFSAPPMGKRGYNQDEVDAFLDYVEANLPAAQGRSGPPPQGFDAAPSPTGGDEPPQLIGSRHQQGADGRRSAASGLDLWRLGKWLSTIIFVSLPLVLFGFAVHDTYVYAVGAETTATVDQCTPGFHLQSLRHSGGAMRTFGHRVTDAVVFRGEGCTATWSLDGKSYSGPLVGGDTDRLDIGAKPHVVVYGGTAYTRESLKDSVGGTILGVTAIVVLLYLFLVWLPARRQTDS
jgi:DivIVA domain-containing protein